MTIKKMKQLRHTIGILPGWPVDEDNRPDSYLMSVLHGLQSVALTRGCHLLLAWGTGRGHNSAVRIPAWPELSSETDFVPVGPWNTDGLIVFAPLLNETRSRYLEKIAAEGHPVLFIATGENGPTVQADNEEGIHQAIAHLVEHGHRKIAFLAGDPRDKGDGALRLAAYASAVEKYKLEADPRLIAYGNHRTADSARALEQILASGVQFTAVLGSDDNAAIGALQALTKAGLRIPQDVAVIGFDDQPDAVAQIPPLASIHVPLAEIGQRALGLMLDFLDGKGRLESIQIPTWLIPRQSCGCLPRNVLSAADSHALPNTLPVSLTETPEVRNRIIQQLASMMLAALPTGSMRLKKVRSQYWCTKLVESFSASLISNSPAQFQTTLMEFLSEAELADGDLHPWQEAISVLRRGMKRLSVNWKQSKLQRLADDMLHQARVAISESAQRRYLRDQYKKRAIDFLLSELNTRLNSIVTEHEAIGLLAEYLPQMGIQHSRVAFFEPDKNDEVAWSIEVDASADAGRNNQRFQSREFPPPNFYPTDQCLNLVLLPLVSQNEPLGYIVFDASHLEPCATIARQFVATIKSARLHAQVTELSLTDALTGLHNRRSFDLFLKNEIDRSRRFRRGLAIILIDIDHFKNYNDAFGHPAGDEALKSVSRCLKENRRSVDVIARIGGEEFAVILPETNALQAMEVAQRMRAAIAQAAGFKRQVTISLGITELGQREGDPEQLLEEADQALYEAKHTGRNRVCIFATQ
jgi:diguanylate cyclase (GGDEF)-like protein